MFHSDTERYKHLKRMVLVGKAVSQRRTRDRSLETTVVTSIVLAGTTDVQQ